MDRRYSLTHTVATRIVVGHRITAELPNALQALAPDRILVVHDQGLAPLAIDLATAVGATSCLPIPGGEASKRLQMAGELASRLHEHGATRASLLLAIGGGALTDLVGFTAAIYQRGVRCAFCPTTTLAMCDAALGGKNGVDHDGLKNQLGTVQQPSLVFADIAWLDSLPDLAFREGLVEVVKKAAVLHGDNFATLEELAPRLIAREPEATLTAVRMAIAMKMAVVAADEHETDQRRVLNFGHTLGHALESLSGETLAHGHAVAMGMLAECRAAADVVPTAVHDRIAALLHALQIDTSIPKALADCDALWRLAQHDKKAAAGRIPMFVPPHLGHAQRVDLDRKRLERALA